MNNLCEMFYIGLRNAVKSPDLSPNATISVSTRNIELYNEYIQADLVDGDTYGDRVELKYSIEIGGIETCTVLNTLSVSYEGGDYNNVNFISLCGYPIVFDSATAATLAVLSNNIIDNHPTILGNYFLQGGKIGHSYLYKVPSSYISSHPLEIENFLVRTLRILSLSFGVLPSLLKVTSVNGRQGYANKYDYSLHEKDIANINALKNCC